MMNTVHVKWGPYHHRMARPQTADGGTISYMEGKESNPYRTWQAVKVPGG